MIVYTKSKEHRVNLLMVDRSGVTQTVMFQHKNLILFKEIKSPSTPKLNKLLNGCYF